MKSQHAKIDCTTLFSNCLGVFQGGGCRAIAYVGAFRKAVEKGIAFSEVAGTSAGAIFAALIAAGATPDFLEKIAYSPELKNIPLPINEQRKGHWGINAFISLAKLKNTVNNLRHKNPQTLFKWEPVKNHRKSLRALIHRFGIFESKNIQHTMNGWLKELTGTDNITFSQLKLPLYVFASDIVNKKCRMWSKENTGDVPVAEAVAASCSIPFYFSPVHLSDENHNKTLYVDGGLLSNRPDFIAKDKPNYFQTISFKLESKPAIITSLYDYTVAIVDTIINGADKLQHMTVGVDDETFGHHQVNEVPIFVDISATDFSKLERPLIDKLLKAGENGMELFISRTNDLLKAEEGFKKYAVTPRRILADREQMYNQVAVWSYEKYDSIIVADHNFDWVWSLFPTLVSWINRGTRVNVFYNSASVTDTDEAQNAKKRLAEHAGCKVESVDPERLITGFFFRNANNYKCVMFEESASDNGFSGKVYNDAVDSHFIKILLSRLLSNIHKNSETPAEITLHSVDKNTITENLQHLPQYSHASFEFKEVPIAELKFLKDNVRSLKYKELRHIKRLYNKAGQREYYPAQLLLSGKYSIITPVIVENHPGLGMIVIKGNARCMKCHNEKKNTIPAIVVSGAEPVDKNINLFGISEMRLSEHKNRGSVKKVLNVFRKIDQNLRPNSTYLKE